MATSTQSATTVTSPALQANTFDLSEIDRFINYDQVALQSPSLSPELARSKSIAPSSSSFGHPLPTLLPTPPDTQQTFSGPSYQYDNYKQQAGLPVGALANTVAVNQAEQLSFRRNNQFFGMPSSHGFFGTNSIDDFSDMSTIPALNRSSNLTLEMDLDFGSSNADPFSQSLDSLTASYVDPAAITGLDNSPVVSQPLQTNNGRAWVGMHQQQAEAKAQAQQKQQQQQAMIQHSQKTSPQPSRRTNGSTVRPPTDPIVEERISRLLSQMRQNSVASSNEEDQAGLSTTNPSGPSRLKKDEEDMDEDERLLASEEGKKLSSKERRQLRNKVSARAFRSRRKEYIGQLENEIAVKSTEVDELKAKNEDLLAENARLTDLTRMLLASPAFSTFLGDLSGNGVQLPDLPASSQASTDVPIDEPRSIPKDINPNQAVIQQAPNAQRSSHIGMALMPETTIDYPAMDSITNNWTGSNDFSLYDAQVFAVTELPRGPALDSVDAPMLSDKPSHVAGSCLGDDDSKINSPVIERMPTPETIESTPRSTKLVDDVDFDPSDPAFALFAEPAYSPSSATLAAVAPTDAISFGVISMGKASPRTELLVEEPSNEPGELSVATLARFDCLCRNLEAVSERIAALIPHP